MPNSIASYVIVVHQADGAPRHLVANLRNRRSGRGFRIVRIGDGAPHTFKTDSGALDAAVWEADFRRFVYDQPISLSIWSWVDDKLGVQVWEGVIK